VRLTVLGCYGPYPPAGGACSGYLVQENGCNILLDCGNGVLSRLQEFVDFYKLDAVMVSHLHADHISDLMIMRYGLEIAVKMGLRDKPLPLYSPPEPAIEFERLPYKNAYQLIPLEEKYTLRIGPFTVTTAAGVHAVPALGFRLETDKGVLVYSGDTENHKALVELARDADLFLCEANYLEEDINSGLPNHLSAGQAAAIAAEAGAARLLLTHIYPARDRSRYLAEARQYYAAAELANERVTYDLRK
jgi:ribonuclease BN (tRNA processing enzyme)